MEKPVLMIHGLGCGGDAWNVVAPLMQQRGWTPFAPTLFPQFRVKENPTGQLSTLSLYDYVEASKIEALAIDHDVPVAVAYTAHDIATDPHMAARGDLIDVADPVAGTIRQQAPYPRFVGEPPPTPAGAPRLGEHTDEILRELLGMDDAALAELRTAATI